MRSLITAALDALFPPICLFCQRRLDFGPRDCFFCDDCRVELTTDPYATCPKCASTIGFGIDAQQGCVNCQEVNFSFTSALRLGPYEGKLRDAILRIKNLDGEPLAEELGRLLAFHHRDRILVGKPNAIVPVPLYFWRRIQRGYNQSAAIAMAIAKVLRLPCWVWWLRRIRNSPRQTGLSRTARQENVRGAFRVRRPLTEKNLRILLIDDVMTTGATLNAAAKALRAGGAAQVDVAVLAHG